MKVSIISTIFATLLAATSAAPIDTSCQSQVDALHQFQIDSLLHFDGNVIVLFFVTTGKDFSMEFQADGNVLRISKSIFIFLSFFTTHRLKNDREF
jgi:hypothetical protein